MSQLEYKKEIERIVLQVPEITWAWIAGFWQAEGSITYSQGASRVSIGQKDREILDRLQEFLGFGYIYEQKVNFGYKTGIYHQLQFNKRSENEIFFTKVLPYLWGDKRDRVLFELSFLDIDYSYFPQEPLCWDYVCAFWEGDGYTSVNDAYFKRTGRGRPYVQSVFCQKDLTALFEIQRFLGKTGSIQPTRKGSDVSKLVAGDLRPELLEYSRTSVRRAELAISLASSDKLEGVSGFIDGYKR